MKAPIPSFPGYEITPDGVVSRNGRVKTVTFDRRGYAYVQMWRDNRGRKTGVHRLIYEAFVGPIPSGMVICHNDGDPRNNAPSNLRADTHAGNMADKERHGTLLRGSRHPHAKLPEELVVRVKTRLKDVWGNRSRVLLVAREFGLPKYAVDEIAKGRNWRHTDPQLDHPTRKPMARRDFGPMVADYIDGMTTKEVIAKHRCDAVKLLAAIRAAGAARKRGPQNYLATKRAALRNRGLNVEVRR